MILGILCEETLSVLFGKIAAKRTKNGDRDISRLRARLGDAAPRPRDLFAKRSIKNSRKSLSKKCRFSLEIIDIFRHL
jgi:hypothetical protein